MIQNATTNSLVSLELCAGAGGQALGLERAGFRHAAVIEIDNWAAETLRRNRGNSSSSNHWPVFEQDIHQFDGKHFRDQIDLLAGGLPCPPFSIAGKQLGATDERDLFPRTLELVQEIFPKAIMIENVKGLAQKRFDPYREKIINQLKHLGYVVDWKLIYSSDFGVPQLRPRFILIAIKQPYAGYFKWPRSKVKPPSVGEALRNLMGENGWEGTDIWASQANDIAPTLVGGSKKHGGPDVGPTRAREAWKKLGIKGSSIADEAPPKGFPINDSSNLPRLTVNMGGVIQGFPEGWIWSGGKTAQWRQVGNAFPPPVAHSIGSAIYAALQKQLYFTT